MLEEAQANPVSKLNPSAPRNVSLIYFFFCRGKTHLGNFMVGNDLEGAGLGHMDVKDARASVCVCMDHPPPPPELLKAPRREKTTRLFKIERAYLNNVISLVKGESILNGYI